MFIISLDWVAISREAVEGVIACVKDFVRDASFTQKNFSSNSGVAMLQDLVAAADSVIGSEGYNFWSLFGVGCNKQFLSDLQSYQQVAFRRKSSRDTSDRCLRTQSARSPSAGTTLRRSCVRISNIVEKGQVD